MDFGEDKDAKYRTGNCADWTRIGMRAVAIVMQYCGVFSGHS